MKTISLVPSCRPEARRTIALCIPLLFIAGACGEAPESAGSSGPDASSSTPDAESSGSDDGGPDSSGSGAAPDAGSPRDGSGSATDAGGPEDANSGAEAGPRPDVVAWMEKVADWQIAQLGTSTAKTWIESVFYAGLMATYRTTGQPRYFNTVKSWGATNQWSLLASTTNADNQCAGQAYLEAYGAGGSPQEIAATRVALDSMVASPQPGRAVWWWCDALFMAPAVFAKASAATSTASYVDAMDAMWWDTAAYLQDSASALFWRDSSFFGRTCPNGQGMFWSRGNGWVIAGTARVIDALPQGYADRSKFVGLLQAMAATLVTLQRPDGYWSSCLTDTQDFPAPETSGTAAFTFAFAWGINRGLLDPAKYRPAVDKGWNALVSAIDATGALGWVQPVGGAPGPSAQSDTAPYGVGLFLLAGSEVAALRP